MERSVVPPALYGGRSAHRLAVLPNVHRFRHGSPVNTEPARKYIPLTQRPYQEIRAEADKYREMAATARSATAKRGLEALAARFSALADRMEAEQTG
jgi:hypothetical protein